MFQPRFIGVFRKTCVQQPKSGRLKTQVLENASTEKASTDRKGGNRKYISEYKHN